MNLLQAFLTPDDPLGVLLVKGRSVSRVVRILSLSLLLAAGPAALSAGAAAPAERRFEMEVMGVAPDPASGAPLVFLRAKEDKRELSIYIGPLEAQAIALPLQGLKPPRPYTHDITIEIIHRLQARVKRVVITALKDNTYFAELILESQGREIVLDSRPSDAIALALREDAPIWAAESVFGRPPRTQSPGAGEPRTP